MHEVSTKWCARITRSLHWIGMKLCDPPEYEGLNDIISFVNAFDM
jgi:hypothetical protein